VTPCGAPAARDRPGAEQHGSAEARLIARKASSEFVRLLGFAGGPQLIHRDNLVLA
jgi:glutamate 5-kinase